MRASLLASACVMLAGAVACAPLVDFNGLSDPHADAGADAGSVSDASHDAASPCQGQNNGFYCGNDALDGYAGSPTDLVLCADNAVDSVVACANGCVISPYLYPDTCDPCAPKPNGTWCGKELVPALRPELANVVFRCESGKNVGQPVACAVALPTCQPRDGGANCVQ